MRERDRAIFDAVMSKNFPKSMLDTKSHIQEAGEHHEYKCQKKNETNYTYT